MSEEWFKKRDAYINRKRRGKENGIEIKRYEWYHNGEHYYADFFPFKDGIPRHDIGCEQCTHFRGEENCEVAQKIESDENLYPFCGQVCSYFKKKEEIK